MPQVGNKEARSHLLVLAGLGGLRLPAEDLLLTWKLTLLLRAHRKYLPIGSGAQRLPGTQRSAGTRREGGRGRLRHGEPRAAPLPAMCLSSLIRSSGLILFFPPQRGLSATLPTASGKGRGRGQERTRWHGRGGGGGVSEAGERGRPLSEGCSPLGLSSLSHRGDGATHDVPVAHPSDPPFLAGTGPGGRVYLEEMFLIRGVLNNLPFWPAEVEEGISEASAAPSANS